MGNLDEIRTSIKNKHRQGVYKSKIIKIPRFVNKLLFVLFITIGTLILLKTNDKIKQAFYEQVFDKHISFASINEMYQNYFGSPIPFKDWFDNDLEPAFNEDLVYKEANIYLDGAVLTVDSSYLVPVLDSGMVIFVGEKEGYGNTIIIEQANGIDVWYGNMGEINAKIYDYVEKGSLLGETKDNKLYLVFMKDGKKVNYEDYI